MRYSTVRQRLHRAFFGVGACFAVGLVASTMASVSPGPAQSREPDHVIRLKHLHTGETGVFTYKRNGRYDRRELAKINHLLRDWRKNQEVNIDPHLLDLIWGVYQQTGANGYINIVCGYRSPATNSMLRTRSRGVAQHSQHMLGKAIDFYIPGVPLAKLRETAMKVQGGGVGYYPTSGSPFVHMDTGNVRAWPRMTRSQLIALFPNGNTLHLPADGKPLPGYERALAQRKSSGGTALAYLDTGEAATKSSGGSWLKRVFSGGADQAEDDEAAGTDTAEVAPASADTPAPPVPAATEVEVPPVLLADAAAEQSRIPRARPTTDAESAIAALSGLPQPDAEVAEEPVQASLAYAPLPRSRPASAVLAETLGTASEQPEPLEVGTEDALAALAAQASAATPDRAPAAGPIAVASAGTYETLAYTPADTQAVPASQTGPSVLAFAGSGLPAASVIPADDRQDALPDVAKPDAFLIAALEAKAEAKRREIRFGRVAAAAQLRELKSQRIRAATEQFAASNAAAPGAAETEAVANVSGAFAGFAQPQPAGASSLFAQPATAGAVADSSARARLPAGRFEPVEADGAQAQPNDSFLSRLFASLSQ